MGMLHARKHAIVVVLPLPLTSPRDVQERHVTVMQRATREYVTLAQRLQPHEHLGGCGGDSSIEATRLVVSLTAFVGNGADMARAVAMSAHASRAPLQLVAKLEEEVKKWRRRRDGEEDNSGSRCGAFVALLEDLATQRFTVSVLSPADALPVAADGEWASALQKQTKIQFVLLRDEDEQSDVASANMLLLLRAVKSCGGRQCSIRQVEDCEVELEGVVKEWLHAAVPIARATLSLREGDRPVEMEVRANFMLLDQSDGVLSSTTALPSHLSSLTLVHFVPLASVHPALLMGCPLRASAADASSIQLHALGRFLRDQRSGALVRSSRADGSRVFYLLVASATKVEGILLMYRVAAAEEILLPEVEIETSDGGSRSLNDEEEQRVTSKIERLRALPMRDFNPFRNRSGVLTTASASKSSSEAPPSKRGQKPATTTSLSVSGSSARGSLPPSTARGLPLAVTSSTGPKQKRRL